jgi:hypothetical protein
MEALAGGSARRRLASRQIRNLLAAGVKPPEELSAGEAQDPFLLEPLGTPMEEEEALPGLLEESDDRFHFESQIGNKYSKTSSTPGEAMS